MDETTDDDPRIVETVPSRAALAGNPSDGYAGAVFAIPVRAYSATVTLRPATLWAVTDERSGERTFDSSCALLEAAETVGTEDPHALLLASVAEFLGRPGVELPACSIEVTSSIPLSVGLAGSSAIVIATLRALHRAAGGPLPDRLSLASVAWSVETQRLGIAAGMQDRLVQTYGRPVLMRFDNAGQDRVSAEIVEPGGDFRLLVAHRSTFAEPSQVVHSDLRTRFDAGDQTLRATMKRLQAHAMSARDAFVAGDGTRLGESMDATYGLRASMIDLVPGHVEMIDAARHAGASANYTGSGGAIVVLSPDAEIESAVRQSLKRLGCEVVSVDAGPGAPGAHSTSSGSTRPGSSPSDSSPPAPSPTD